MSSSKVYDSADEIEREVQSKGKSVTPKTRRVRLARRVQAPQNFAGVDLSREIRTAPTQPTTQPTTQPSPITPIQAGGEEELRPSFPVPLGFDPTSFPTSLQWTSKMEILGAVFMVAEALGRTAGSPSEFTDRVAWVACLQVETDKDNSLKRCQLYRRQLSELRATHLTFGLAASHDLIHAAILILMRAIQFLSMVYEIVAEPFAWVVEKNVQELVFLCDFVSVVCNKGEASAFPLSIPALYANETFVRMLPVSNLLGTELESSAGLGLIKALTEQANIVSNPWLRKNLMRLATGLKIFIQNEYDQNKTVHIILKERADAIVNWGRIHGMDKTSMFHDPLFAVN